MAQQNADQIAAWNGQSGERWVANQARLDAMLAVFGQAAIEAAAPVTGERVLDVGCGAGASSLDLATRVGAGEQRRWHREAERLAVLLLMTSSYFVANWTGRSAGFSPLRMRST